jgi:anti-anti-sigma factor
MSKILVIDDEKPTLSMFRLFLKVYGFTVLTAETGEEGLEVFAAERPPIVLTDIKMPGMDGIEVLKRVKEIDPVTEVIVITGHGDMDLAIKALNLDATDFINKPIQRQELEAALKRAKERIQLARHKSDEIAVRRQGEAGLIDIQGNVSSRSEPFLAEAFQKAGREVKGLVLVFNENASINGAGIALLTQLLLDCQKRGLAVGITGLSENFRKVFEIVGVNKLARLYDSEAEALAGIGARN